MIKWIMAGRESFWEFCKLNNASFYKDSRPHLKELCDTLQALFEGRLIAPDGKVCKRLAISEPPRHGKSYTMAYQAIPTGREDPDLIASDYKALTRAIEYQVLKAQKE